MLLSPESHGGERGEASSFGKVHGAPRRSPCPVFINQEPSAVAGLWLAPLSSSDVCPGAISPDVTARICASLGPQGC